MIEHKRFTRPRFSVWIYWLIANMAKVAVTKENRLIVNLVSRCLCFFSIAASTLFFCLHLINAIPALLTKSPVFDISGINRVSLLVSLPIKFAASRCSSSAFVVSTKLFQVIQSNLMVMLFPTFFAMLLITRFVGAASVKMFNALLLAAFGADYRGDKKWYLDYCTWPAINLFPALLASGAVSIRITFHLVEVFKGFFLLAGDTKLVSWLGLGELLDTAGLIGLIRMVQFGQGYSLQSGCSLGLECATNALQADQILPPHYTAKMPLKQPHVTLRTNYPPTVADGRVMSWV